MMDDDDIAELAKGMVPFVRDCVTEALLKSAVPADLAAQIASAVRLLHEMPALEQRAEAPRTPRIARVERDADGNFVPIYDETQT
jgi:hypothetical protein